MANDNHQSKPFNLIAFLRRSQEWLEVSGYHVGDIYSETKPVLVTEGTTVVGNIFAHQVRVSGLVSGSVATRQLEIESTGQIWGDLYTFKLDIKSGGTVQGWISSIDEETITTLLAEHRLPDEIATTEMDQLPEDEYGTPLPGSRDSFELTAYHQLQSEIATAKAARAELETSFEKRLSEVAGESSSKISVLSEQLENTRTDLTNTQNSLLQSEETVKNKDAQIQRQQNELALSRNLITEQSQKLEQLQQSSLTLKQQLLQLQLEKGEVDQTLQQKLQQLEEQADRIHSIETAMQDSLQHSSDLEESLVRWQELAEVTENQVNALEKDLANANFQLKENGKLIDMLQQQKQHAEEDWQKLHAELESFRSDPEHPAAGIEAANKNKQILAEATAQIEQLETELESLSQERAEQILWYRASLETSMNELEQIKQQAQAYEAELEALQSRLTEQENEAKMWKTAVSRLKSRMEQQQEKWEQQQEMTRREIKSLKESQKQKEQQIAAANQDLAFHINEIEKQGLRLAESQATLTERELQLKQAQKLILKQNQMIKEMRQKTEAYILKLQSQLQSSKATN